MTYREYKILCNIKKIEDCQKSRMGSAEKDMRITGYKSQIYQVVHYNKEDLDDILDELDKRELIANIFNNVKDDLDNTVLTDDGKFAVKKYPKNIFKNIYDAVIKPFISAIIIVLVTKVIAES